MTERRIFVTAFALAMGAAVSLGLARFSYALLLPPMRSDLGWSYFTAGAMNTVNAVGYLAGALLLPRALGRLEARTVFLAGGWGAAALLALHGLVRDDALLYVLRGLTGVVSAISFASGGLLAAWLGQAPGAKPSLVLGLYYGGTGLGIVASALVVPPLPWPSAWQGLALAALAATLVMAWGTKPLAAAPAAPPARGEGFRARDFAFGLAGYLMFGLGYIGYMTFIVTLLKEQGASAGTVVAFYILLGTGVIASSWLWAPLLQRYRGGQPLALLNALLALATLLPVLSAHPLAAFASGALFGAVLLSLVASTTALVRHNLPPAAWPAGIAAFTSIFAAGQIVGPILVGWVADGAGGLLRGLAISALLLAVGAALAALQKPLTLH
ncbi:YbfB/YjiJ family MFS transporter [uncultured Piscinibacter sp.]|uniref:YbfB/YjiJ family MFS transporter n=1 Tax=uncultured Piscinibacter sp. TaxID=1131835 RepID=UPI00260DB9EF|nr:YbfB/YjiJ family MFS transporter [uncultured Piscinibacter sp.]